MHADFSIWSIRVLLTLVVLGCTPARAQLSTPRGLQQPQTALRLRELEHERLRIRAKAPSFVPPAVLMATGAVAIASSALVGIITPIVWVFRYGGEDDGSPHMSVRNLKRGLFVTAGTGAAIVSLGGIWLGLVSRRRRPLGRRLREIKDEERRLRGAMGFEPALSPRFAGATMTLRF